MKNRVVSGILFFVTGVLLAIGPYTIFPVCRSSMMLMRCQSTAKAELIAGVLIALIGAVVALIRPWRVRFFLSVAEVFLGILALLFPNALIGVCANTHMTCRALTLPAVSVLGILLIAFAGFNARYLWKIGSKGVASNGAGIKPE